MLVRSIFIAAMLVATSALAGPLDKPSAPDAREHLDKGNALLTNREFEAAIAEYKAGALIENAPLFQYNIALSYRLLGKYEDSIWFYERFISRAQPTGEMLDGIKKLIDQMKAELEQRAKTQAPTEPAPSSEATGTASTPALDTTSERNSITSSTQSTPSTDWFGIGLISAGGVGVLVGGGLLWDASMLRDDANATSDQSERDALYAKADTRSLAGWITGGIGAAVLTTGVIKLVVGRGSNASSSQHATWNVGATSNGVLVFGQF